MSSSSLRSMLLGLGLMASACAPTTGVPATPSPTYQATDCVAPRTSDSVCARQIEVGYGQDQIDLTPVAPNEGASLLSGARYVEARGRGSFDLVLAMDALCKGDAGDQRPTGLWTRSPADALLTVISGRLTCTVSGGRLVKVAPHAVLNADGTVSLRDVVMDISSAAPNSPAPFILDFDPLTGRTSVHAFAPLRVVLSTGREVVLEAGEYLAIAAQGAPNENSRRTFAPPDITVINRQREVIR